MLGSLGQSLQIVAGSFALAADKLQHSSLHHFVSKGGGQAGAPSGFTFGDIPTIY